MLKYRSTIQHHPTGLMPAATKMMVVVMAAVVVAASASV
jgi:hypothetical protein